MCRLSSVAASRKKERIGSDVAKPIPLRNRQVFEQATQQSINCAKRLTGIPVVSCVEPGFERRSLSRSLSRSSHGAGGRFKECRGRPVHAAVAHEHGILGDPFVDEVKAKAINRYSSVANCFDRSTSLAAVNQWTRIVQTGNIIMGFTNAPLVSRAAPDTH